MRGQTRKEYRLSGHGPKFAPFRCLGKGRFNPVYGIRIKQTVSSNSHRRLYAVLLDSEGYSVNRCTKFGGDLSNGKEPHVVLILAEKSARICVLSIILHG